MGEVSAVYRRRRPERSALYRVVQEHLNTFLAQAEARSPDGRGLPRYVRGAFRRYLDCVLLLRPPFASERLEQLSDGRVLYRFLRPRPDGSSHVLMDPLDFMARLAALVPPPRFHLVRYHGILGPHHGLRSRGVPKAGHRRRRKRCEEAFETLDDLAKRRRTDWATMLRRSMGLDALSCPSCGGRLGFETCVEEPDEIRAWLRSLGEPEEPRRSAPRALRLSPALNSIKGDDPFGIRPCSPSVRSSPQPGPPALRCNVIG